MNLQDLIVDRMEQATEKREEIKLKRFTKPLTYYHLVIGKVIKGEHGDEVDFELTKTEFNSLADVYEFIGRVKGMTEARMDPIEGTIILLSSERSIWEDLTYYFVQREYSKTHTPV